MAKYDYYHPVRFSKEEANIYHCPICGKSLEIKAYRMLEKKAEELNSMHYENLIQNVLSLNIECCGQDYIAFFHKKIGELIKDFFLIEIKNSIIKIEGLYTTIVR